MLALPIQTPFAAIVQTDPHNHSANNHNPLSPKICKKINASDPQFINPEKSSRYLRSHT